MGERNGTPDWLKAFGVLIGTLGLPAFLLLWWGGAFDGFLPSPVSAQIRTHDEKTIRVQRLICAGIWRDEPTMQRECWQ